MIRGPRQAVAALGLIAAIAASIAAGPPEVVRVRAPASEIGKWFPAGTELISLPPEEFEDLARKAREAGEVASQDRGRVLRATHRARWEDGVLIGRSTFTVRRDAAGPSLVPLAPWNLAVDREEGKESPLRAADDGRVFFRLPPDGPAEVTVAWHRAPRLHSEGRSFTLDLPRAAIGAIELDLPDRFLAESFVPAPAGDGGLAAGRRLWRRPVPAGPVEIRLRDRDERGGGLHERPWVWGPSEIDVGPASAAWRADWSVETNGSSRPLHVGFSPGLEPTEAGGPDVESTELRRTPGGVEMTIRLRPDLRGSTSILLRGLAAVRIDGPWPLPTAWPIDGEWLGGNVAVRLDRSRALASCRTLQGRRLAVSAEGGAEKSALLFEPTRAGPVAELTFAGDAALRAARVHGAVRYARAGSTLTAELGWTFPRGRPGALAFDLPAGWSIQAVTVGDDPVPWHREDLGTGPARVWLMPPSVDAETIALSARVRAGGPAAGDAPLELPRVRPVGVAADETWIAVADEGRSVVPRAVDGLAWIDPTLASSPGLRAAIEPAMLAHALAWRWTGERGSATAILASPPREVVARAEGTAVIAAGRIRTDWRLTIRPGAHPLASIPLAWSCDEGRPIRWRLLGGPAADPELAPRPLLPAERIDLGFAESTHAEVIALPEPTSSTVILEGTEDRPWAGRGPIPLPRMPATFRPRGRLAIYVETDLLTQLAPRGLQEMDGGLLGFDPSPRGRSGPPEGVRLDRILGFDGAEASLELTTVASRSPVREEVVTAHLLTSPDASGGACHQLSLRFLTPLPREISLSMPPGTELRRARQGDRPLEVLSGGDGLRISIRPDRRAEVVLDYKESRPIADVRGRRLRPTIPKMSLPCLHFLWTVVPPGGSTFDAIAPGLVPIGPPETSPGFSPPWPGDRSGRSLGVFAEEGSKSVQNLEELREILSAPRSAANSELGPRLLVVANACGAVVVDRVGFEEAGLRPDSVVPDFTGEITSGSTPDRLELGGLCFLPRRGVLAITTRSMPVVGSLGDREVGARFDESIRSAVLNGSSADSRWLALEEWCADPSEGRRPSPSSPIVSGARSDFVCNGWPGADSCVEEVPIGGSFVAFTLGIATALGVGLALRGCPTRWRVMALAVPSVAIYLFPSVLASLPRGAGPGVGWGILGAWLIQPPGRRRSSAGATSQIGISNTRGPSSIVRGIVALALAFPLLLGPQAPALADSSTSDVILAILPYDGPPDLRAAPTRVILRLADHERLKAAVAARSADRGGAFAVDALHRVEAGDDRAARVSSELSLVVEGDDPVEWRIPTSGAWAIRATLDGASHPIRLEGEGQTGLVSIRGRGTHKLRLDRVVAVESSDGGRKVVVPINPIPRAAAEFKVPGAGPPSLKGAVRAAGSEPDGAPISIGPMPELELILPPAIAKDSAVAPGIHGLLLWDALPAGDRVRLRLSPTGSEPLAELRLGFGTDVCIRPVDRHRLLRSLWVEGGGAHEWFAAFDPPCTQEAPVEIELWRPRARLAGGDTGPRRIPKVTAIGSAFQGTIAFRRPGDWSGRLDGPGGSGPRDEESFVASWGPLPDEPLTLAGAIGFRGLAQAEVLTQPIPLRRSVTPEVRLDLGAGRVDLTLEAAVRDISGQSSEVDVDLPPEFVLEHVGADGLISSCRPEPGRVHLELARVPGGSHKVVIRGYLLVGPDAASGEARRYRMKTPWPRWSNAAEEPGLLTVASATRSSLEAGADLTPLPDGEAPTTPTPPASRKTYKVDRPSDLGAIQWLAGPPRVSVFLQSRLAVGREAAELDSAIRYEVTGGPLDVVYLRLPAAWAKDARVDLVGETSQRTAETRGEWTTWTIRPDRPIWGSSRLRVHSTRADLRGQTFPFPDIIPLGQGRVEKILSVDRPASVPIEIEGSAGLQSVDPGRLDDVWPEDPATSDQDVYRVASERWALTIRPGAERHAPSPGGSAAVVEAESFCSLRGDGAVMGMSTFLVDSRLGASLRLRSRPQARVLSTRVGGRPSGTLSAREGEWSIPLESAGLVEVDVLWADETGGPGPSRGEVVIPRPDQGDVPTLVRISADPSVSLRSDGPAFEAMGARTWRIEQAERLARRIVALIGDFDRSSSSEEAELAGLLARFALVARLADRAIQSDLSTPSAGAPISREPLRLRLEESRRAISESLELYGLDDLRPALGLTGRSGAVDLAERRAATVRPLPLPLGRAAYYRSGPAGSRDESIAWARQDSVSRAQGGTANWPGAAAILFLLLPRSLGVAGFRSRAFGVALAAVLVGVAILEPIPGVILILAAWLGRT